MGERLPRVTGREAIAALKRGGWTNIRTTGSHVHLRHPTRGRLVTVPQHPGEIVLPATLKSILKQADLTVEEFKELL